MTWGRGCSWLAANGWLHEQGDHQKYDRSRALFPDDLIAWIKETQPDAWAKIEKSHGASATNSLLDRVRDQLDKQGTLDVIRHGIDFLGVQGKLKLAAFRPASGLNPDILKRYNANRLRVVRQVRYSLYNENSIDLVLFLNGIPIATAELKTDFTQSVSDAIFQYKKDRLPKPKGQGAEPLLSGMYVDKKLSGIQAVQTLSRLNRAYPGKDTTYVIDLFNEGPEVLESFKMYYETAELAGNSDPNMVFDLRGKLDGQGYYDEHEIDRVVEVEINADPESKQTQAKLAKAIEPVVDRLLKKYQAAQKDLLVAQETQNQTAEEEAQATLDALQLFKRDMGTFVRVYTFLSQIMDFGNSEIEKRAIFYRRLIPLLDFGREREGIDLSKVTLTHHSLRNLGKQSMALGKGGQLQPVSESGSGEVHTKEKALLSEIIEKVNDLFEGELSDEDKLVYVNNVLKGKLLESDKLRQQAENNSKSQFSNSPDLYGELIDATISADEAHGNMSKQVLISKELQAKLLEILLGPGQLYETLREAEDRS